MADKNLQRLSRKELLSIMISQGKEIDSLKEELRQANEKLQQRDICIRESGSIAEAALKLNNIFQDAEMASKQYLDSIKAMAQQEKEALTRIQAKEKKLQVELSKAKLKKGSVIKASSVMKGDDENDS
jgi:light-regulated signal transduction histidine kinase (bacteriophytochrome)